ARARRRRAGDPEESNGGGSSWSCYRQLSREQRKRVFDLQSITALAQARSQMQATTDIRCQQDIRPRLRQCGEHFLAVRGGANRKFQHVAARRPAALRLRRQYFDVQPRYTREQLANPVVV